MIKEALDNGRINDVFFKELTLKIHIKKKWAADARKVVKDTQPPGTAISPPCCYDTGQAVTTQIDDAWKKNLLLAFLTILLMRIKIFVVGMELFW